MTVLVDEENKRRLAVSRRHNSRVIAASPAEVLSGARKQTFCICDGLRCGTRRWAHKPPHFVPSGQWIGTTEYLWASGHPGGGPDTLVGAAL